MTIKAKMWNGRDLTGVWKVFRKLDGVRATTNCVIIDKKLQVLSKHGKPLYNLDKRLRLFDDAEVWLGNFKDTISAVRTKNKKIYIPRSAIYRLDPPDHRLLLDVVEHPTAKTIRHMLKKYKAPGEDGLVLRQGKKWLKVKHVETFDVMVTNYQPGKGKHKGRMGALMTPMGKVGTGFSDKLRKRGPEYWMGKIIEVACGNLTPGGKFRHARFMRIREDK